MKKVYNLKKGEILPIESFTTDTYMDVVNFKVLTSLIINIIYSNDTNAIDSINVCDILDKGLFIYSNLIYYHFKIIKIEDMNTNINQMSIELISNEQIYYLDLPHWVLSDIREVERIKLINDILE